MDLYTKDGEKVASLTRFMPEIRPGDVMLVRIKDHLLAEEKSALTSTLHQIIGQRARLIVVDESTSMEVVPRQDLKARVT